MIGRMTGHAAGPPGDYRECGPAACDLLIRGRRVVTPAGLRAAAVGIAGGQVSAIEPAAGPAAETGSPRSQVSAARPAGRLLAREGAAA